MAYAYIQAGVYVYVCMYAWIRGLRAYMHQSTYMHGRISSLLHAPARNRVSTWPTPVFFLTNIPFGRQGGILFVAIRGDSYGWTPRVTDMPPDVRDEWPNGLSLQAAEIKCALLLGGVASRGVVCYREQEVPTGEAASQARDKLEAERLELEKNENVRIRTYNFKNGDHGDVDESVANFESIMHDELDAVLEEWCAQLNMPKPLWEISRVEAQREVEAHAAPVMKNKRKAATVATREKKVSVTRPTFRQTMAWQCHAALAERLSRSCIGMSKELAAICQNIRKGIQTTLLVGKPGSGKSCVMARVARRYFKAKCTGLEPRINTCFSDLFILIEFVNKYQNIAFIMPKLICS